MTGAGDVVLNGKNEESIAASEGRQSAPSRKLGFGLVGSGKRTVVPSVFHEEEDDDAHKDKKMRHLVPIDYSTEEIQVVNLTYLWQHHWHQIWWLHPKPQSMAPVLKPKKRSSI